MQKHLTRIKAIFSHLQKYMSIGRNQAIETLISTSIKLQSKIIIFFRLKLDVINKIHVELLLNLMRLLAMWRFRILNFNNKNLEKLSSSNDNVLSLCLSCACMLKTDMLQPIKVMIDYAKVSHAQAKNIKLDQCKIKADKLDKVM